MPTKTKRPTIPNSVKFQLWTSAGGVCQYPGCNTRLCKHSPTSKRGNFAQMAHIIGVNGPRSDENSKELAIAFENILLLCPACHKLIDEDVFSHPTDILYQWKKNSEKRMSRLLSMQENQKRKVLVLRTAISRENFPAIGNKDINDALLENGNYPSTEHPAYIELLTKYKFVDWDNARQQISDQMLPFQQDLHYNEDMRNGIAVFAIGSIPLLMQFGMELPRTTSVDIYQRSRVNQKWLLNDTTESNEPLVLEIFGKAGSNGTVNVVVSISGKINFDSLPDNVKGEGEIYCIDLNGGLPGMTFSTTSVNHFVEIWLKVQRLIFEKYGADAVMNIFAAVPAAIAIYMGYARLPGVSPTFRIYEYNKDSKTFSLSLTLK